MTTREQELRWFGTQLSGIGSQTLAAANVAGKLGLDDARIALVLLYREVERVRATLRDGEDKLQSPAGETIRSAQGSAREPAQRPDAAGSAGSHPVHAFGEGIRSDQGSE